LGVAIDPAANKVYWANVFNNTISFANLDNTGGGGQLNTTGATSNNPLFLALLERPSGAGAPAVSGSTTSGSTLSCSPGAWAADDPGGFLSRAPNSYTYSWTLDGATIPGETSNATVANSAGDYACEVTAVNHAGTTTQTSVAQTVLAPPAAPVNPAITSPALRPLSLAVTPGHDNAGTRGCFAFRTTPAGGPSPEPPCTSPTARGAPHAPARPRYASDCAPGGTTRPPPSPGSIPPARPSRSPRSDRTRPGYALAHNHPTRPVTRSARRPRHRFRHGRDRSQRPRLCCVSLRFAPANRSSRYRLDDARLDRGRGDRRYRPFLRTR
jgi:hypothetical protein